MIVVDSIQLSVASRTNRVWGCKIAICGDCSIATGQNYIARASNKCYDTTCVNLVLSHDETRAKTINEIVE